MSLTDEAAISPRFDGAIRAATARAPFRLGILGGTFDPIHNAHLHIAERAYEQYSLDGVLVLPTGEPFWKPGNALTAAELRYAMVAAAIGDNSRFDISRMELDRGGPTYTIDSLRSINQAYGDRLQLFFIVGADCATDISNWKGAAEIAGLTTILAAKRAFQQQSDGSLPDDVSLSGDDRVTDNGMIFDIRQIDSAPMDMSSRMLRQWVRQGRSIRYLVPEAVFDFILNAGLYRD